MLLNVDMLDGMFCGEFKLDRVSLDDLSYQYNHVISARVIYCRIRLIGEPANGYRYLPAFEFSRLCSRI